MFENENEVKMRGETAVAAVGDMSDVKAIVSLFDDGIADILDSVRYSAPREFYVETRRYFEDGRRAASELDSYLRECSKSMQALVDITIDYVGGRNNVGSYVVCDMARDMRVDLDNVWEMGRNLGDAIAMFDGKSANLEKSIPADDWAVLTEATAQARQAYGIWTNKAEADHDTCASFCRDTIESCTL